MERSAKAITSAITEEWTERTPIVVFAGQRQQWWRCPRCSSHVGRRWLPRSASTCSTSTTSLKTAPPTASLIDQRKTTSSMRFPSAFPLSSRRAPRHQMVSSARDSTKHSRGRVRFPCRNTSTRVRARGEHRSAIEGLMCEDNTNNIHSNIIRADLTLTLQQRKLSMLVADCQQCVRTSRSSTSG